MEGAALRVAQRVVDYEHAIDQALISACALIAEIPAARLDANVAAEHGQDAIEELALTIPVIAAARRHGISGHAKLEEARKALRLREIAAGYKNLLHQRHDQVKAQAAA